MSFLVFVIEVFGWGVGICVVFVMLLLLGWGFCWCVNMCFLCWVVWWCWLLWCKLWCFWMVVIGCVFMLSWVCFCWVVLMFWKLLCWLIFCVSVVCGLSVICRILIVVNLSLWWLKSSWLISWLNCVSCVSRFVIMIWVVVVCRMMILFVLLFFMIRWSLNKLLWFCWICCLILWCRFLFGCSLKLVCVLWFWLIWGRLCFWFFIWVWCVSGEWIYDWFCWNCCYFCYGFWWLFVGWG